MPIEALTEHAGGPSVAAGPGIGSWIVCELVEVDGNVDRSISFTPITSNRNLKSSGSAVSIALG